MHIFQMTHCFEAYIYSLIEVVMVSLAIVLFGDVKNLVFFTEEHYHKYASGWSLAGSYTTSIMIQLWLQGVSSIPSIEI